MKGFRFSPALARSASVIAVASMLALPAVASAQAAPPADPQQGTPQADTSPPANQPVTESGATATNAVPDTQAADVQNEITVTGVRASLERSIAIKRNSTGIVDAISAEDIGKFPDTNLAESLQRITGVSIDRVNGEGAQVTVRGFGPDYNLVTLNGRTLASTYDQTVGADESGDGIHPITRSFDFSNLASEGVKTLEVYKTGRSAVPSGGIGATINVVTRRPLDAREPGFNGSLGAKADWDTSADDCVHCGGKVTPDLTGLLSWSNPNQTFGVSVFGSYQERHFSTIAATSNAWNIVPYSTFLSGGYIRSYTPAATDANPNPAAMPAICGSAPAGTPCTTINNAPNDPNQLVSVPNDSRYHFSDDEYKRLNLSGVVQFRPIDSLTLTADALYARTTEKEQRSDESNWFNRPFDVVTFDGGKDVDTTTYLHEVLGNSPKDEDWEQQYRAQENKLQDYGINAKWDMTSNFTAALDAHWGKSEVLPYNPNGTTSTLVGLGADVITAHSVDYSGDIPVQDITIDDGPKGNGNGQLDTGDVGSSVGRTFTNSDKQTVKEARLDFGWDLGGGSRFDFGGLYRDVKTRQDFASTQQILGNWSVDHPGDVDTYAPGALSEFCLLCKFKDFDPKASGANLIAFRGNAIDIYNALSQHYGGDLDPNSGTNKDNEKIWAAYGQITWKGQIANLDASLVAGVRYEHTQETAASIYDLPTNILWTGDNDFTVTYSSTPGSVPGKSSYDNVLPAMDFQVGFAKNLIGRLSFSKTLARPDYNLLFPSTSVGGPPRATYLGGFPSASEGNTSLRALTSDNVDLSLEYYFKKDSYVSVGFFDKRVHNFITTGQTSGGLFGLLDPTSGAAGTRSGAAIAALQALGANIDDINYFTYTALLDNESAAAAKADFLANYDPSVHDENQNYVNQILSKYDVAGKAGDPAYNFAISKPVNSKDAEVYGIEAAAQFFFGDSGVGVAGSFTYVKGDIHFDNGALPSIQQFALTGLSNTANATLIYDKYGISARLAYNWRDKFLAGTGRDGYQNPTYTRPFGQLDLNISYDITKNIAVSIEGINLTNEALRTYGRSTDNLWFAQELQRRFLFGARYRF